MDIFVLCAIISSGWGIVASMTIDVPECRPPDTPQWGGYGPRETFYLAGDVVHYYCDTDFYIGGNYYRRCEDTGDWTGDTPPCDAPQAFSSVNQTTTADPTDQNGAVLATDGSRTTCSHTKGGGGESWIGMLKTPGELFRVMVYLPKMDVAYEVFMIKADGQELSCGSIIGRIESLFWQFHNCPGPNNRDVVGVKIKSLSNEPLRLCEVVAHVLTYPTCIDPHLQIDNGHLEFNRKTATLVCDATFIESRSTKLTCIRTGVWDRKMLFCSNPEESWKK